MRPLSLAAGVVPEIGDPAELVTLGAMAGFRHVGVRLDLAPPSRRCLAAAARRARDLGVEVLDVEVVRLTEGDRQDATNRSLLAAAAQLMARFVLVVSELDDPAATAAALGRYAADLEGTGVELALEFMRFSSVPSLAAACRAVERLGREDVHVLVDTLHLARADEGAADLHRARARIGYVQLCDAGPDVPTSLDGLYAEAVDLRRLPGDGVLPLRTLLDVLPAAMPCSLEIRSSALRGSLAPLERARTVRERTEGFLTAGPRDTASSETEAPS